jgi:hypothetical protein
MTAFRYPSAPLVRRHGPSGYASAESFRPWLRDEFTFRCVYCLYREQWGRLKGHFALDHFLPVSVHPLGERTYENLLYACAACNLAKGVHILPDPTQAFLDGDVRVLADGRMEAATPDARRIIRVIGLDDPEEAEKRLLWQGIIALAVRYDPPLYQRLMGYPDDLPNLAKLRPPAGNTRPAGIQTSYYARRHAGSLPPTY